MEGNHVNVMLLSRSIDNGRVSDNRKYGNILELL